jgi:hypothetical protein
MSVRDEYNVNHFGLITDPGKFEGEPIYIPHFWQIGLEGLADEDDGETFLFHVTDEDRKQFPEIPADQSTIRLAERSDGFVHEV